MIRSTSDSGFSLLEVLVAFAVLASIAGVSVGFLSGAVSSQQQTSAVLDRVAGLDRMRILLRDDFGQLVLRSVRGAQGEREPFTFGAWDTAMAERQADGAVRLLALTRRGGFNPGGLEPHGGLMRVEYLLRGDRLVRRARRWPDPTSPEAMQEMVLAADLESVTVEARIGSGWVRRWIVAAEEGGDMPSAIRLRYGRGDGDVVEYVVLTPRAGGVR
ncbi:GspJ family type II secretion system protein [Maricaulis sp.]|jgi:general secretion pathway protein J|uniref:GspJ family type II secretion system protein n=1 Tax=Maricaulis sp. TaxID=1486257 RepID=UPI00261E687F|nr:GspJ family type II secretion system protein [Maricaulis sp.]MDF1767913.1 GspJ family type II secretion system protein [Maricaulis sp.]